MQHDRRYRFQSLLSALSFLAMLLVSACSLGTTVQTKTAPSPSTRQQIYIETSKNDPSNPYIPESPQVYGIDAASGAQTWHAQLNGPTTKEPVIIGNSLYLATVDLTTLTGRLYELATANGRVLHQQDTAGSSYQYLFAAGDILIGYLVAATTDPLSPSVNSPKIVGLRSTDLAQIWQVPIHNSDRTIMRVSGTTIFVELPNASANVTVALAIDAKTGKQIWQRQLNLFGNNMVAAGNALYFWSGTTTTLLTALDAATGKQIWQITVSHSLDLIDANTDEVFVETTNQLEAFHARDGTLSWQGPLNIHESLIINGGTIYEVSNANPSIIAALDAHSGHVIWTMPLSTVGSYAVVAVSADAVFTARESHNANGTHAGIQIEAFKRSDGTSMWKYPVQDGVNWLVTG